jgi:IS5 family transposase
MAQQPDVILSHGTAVTAALQRQTRTIPIVFVVVSDPVGSGFVASLSRPSGNITGFRAPRKIAAPTDLCESPSRCLIREARMGQFGFFDAEKRLAALSAKGDPLESIDRLIPWERFRADIEAVVLTPDEIKKSSAGRKPVDAIVMFRMLVLQALHNLSDEQAEYQVRDRLSFTRFLRLGLEDRIPDATTLWLFREKLAKAGLIEKLFERFDGHLAAQGYMARGGQMIDATIVPVPKQRNSRDENETVKAGETPADWEKKPAKLRQKDRDARWTKKHGKSFFGYKNHVNADAKHKLIRRYEVTDAAVHDSQPLDALLTKGNTSADVFADSAYRSAAIEAKLKARGFNSRIHRRANRNHPLSDAQTRANRAKSRIRARIEHVFGAQQSSAGGRLVRTIGIMRARAKIGLQNLTYNIRRLVTLERMAAA